MIMIIVIVTIVMWCVEHSDGISRMGDPARSVNQRVPPEVWREPDLCQDFIVVGMHGVTALRSDLTPTLKWACHLDARWNPLKRSRVDGLE